jgi:hypothetical protein
VDVHVDTEHKREATLTDVHVPFALLIDVVTACHKGAIVSHIDTIGLQASGFPCLQQIALTVEQCRHQIFEGSRYTTS